MEQKALCESAFIVLSDGKATVSLEANNVVQALVNSPGLARMQTAFPHMASPQITPVTSSHLYRLTRIRLPGAGKQACQVKINVTVEMSTSGLIMAAFFLFHMCMKSQQSWSSSDQVNWLNEHAASKKHPFRFWTNYQKTFGNVFLFVQMKNSCVCSFLLQTFPGVAKRAQYRADQMTFSRRGK